MDYHLNSILKNIYIIPSHNKEKYYHYKIKRANSTMVPYKYSLFCIIS